jgi:hypothetical protein
MVGRGQVCGDGDGVVREVVGADLLQGGGEPGLGSPLAVVGRGFLAALAAGTGGQVEDGVPAAGRPVGAGAPVEVSLHGFSFVGMRKSPVG